MQEEVEVARDGRGTPALLAAPMRDGPAAAEYGAPGTMGLTLAAVLALAQVLVLVGGTYSSSRIIEFIYILHCGLRLRLRRRLELNFHFPSNTINTHGSRGYLAIWSGLRPKIRRR